MLILVDLLVYLLVDLLVIWVEEEQLVGPPGSTCWVDLLVIWVEEEQLVDLLVYLLVDLLVIWVEEEQLVDLLVYLPGRPPRDLGRGGTAGRPPGLPAGRPPRDLGRGGV